MRHADPVHSVVVDVLGPRAALDMQQLPHGRVLELHGDQGRLVVLLKQKKKLSVELMKIKIKMKLPLNRRATKSLKPKLLNSTFCNALHFSILRLNSPD